VFFLSFGDALELIGCRSVSAGATMIDVFAKHHLNVYDVLLRVTY
jgi:hypothetical protein